MTREKARQIVEQVNYELRMRGYVPLTEEEKLKLVESLLATVKGGDK